MSILFILVIGFAVALVCRYIAGLIGASSSPISGVGILVAIATALVMKVVHGTVAGDELSVLVAYALFTAALVLGITTISNDDLQDLKTGQLVGAAPWKQQLALIVDVDFGVIIIPPVLSLMHRAFGFQGAPGAGQNALATPQTSLISDPIKGVFDGDLNWGLLGTGALVGMIVIIIDEVFKHAMKRFSLSGLAIGMGMCLPMATTIVIPIDALLGLLHDQWAERQANPEKTKRMGTLVAMGLIVSEPSWGVVYAGIVGFSDRGTPLVLFGEPFATPTQWVGTILFVAATIYLYKDIRSKAKAH